MLLSIPFRTMRAKLIATTMLVFIVLLVVVAVIFDASSRRALLRSVDVDLERRGLDFARVVTKHGGPGDHHDHPNIQGPGEGPRSPRFNEGQGPRPPRIRDSQWIAPLNIPLLQRPGEPDAKSLAYDYEAYLQSALGKTRYTTRFVDGEPRRVFSAPAKLHGRIISVVQVSSSLGPALSALDSQRATLLQVVIPFGLLLGVFASFLVVASFMKPLRYLTSEAERIGTTGFDEKLDVRGNDEFAQLTVTLNGMLARLETMYRQEQDANRRLEETVQLQRRFTSDASHELKTPLAIIKAYLGVLKKSRRNVSEEGELIEAMDDGANRMNGLVQDLLLLARTDAGMTEPRTPCRVEQLIQKAIRRTPFGPERTQVDLNGTATILASEKELVRVFINLIDNAIKYGGDKGPVVVNMDTDDSYVTVCVRDCGPGIASAHIPHLFERFYRTDESRNSDAGGTGLGLAICDQIVRSHGGEITVRSVVGEGASFSVRLLRLHSVFTQESHDE